jgi:hypothetical protein
MNADNYGHTTPNYMDRQGETYYISHHLGLINPRFSGDVSMMLWIDMPWPGIFILGDAKVQQKFIDHAHAPTKKVFW